MSLFTRKCVCGRVYNEIQKFNNKLYKKRMKMKKERSFCFNALIFYNNFFSSLKIDFEDEECKEKSRFRAFESDTQK